MERISISMIFDLCDPGTILYQLNYHVNWEKVIIRFYDTPVDSGLIYVM